MHQLAEKLDFEKLEKQSQQLWVFMQDSGYLGIALANVPQYEQIFLEILNNPLNQDMKYWSVLQSLFFKDRLKKEGVFHRAILKDCDELVKAMLGMINIREPYYLEKIRDPLSHAAFSNHAKVFKVLIQASNADTEKFYWLLENAARNGHVKIVQILLEDNRVCPSGLANRILFLAVRVGCRKVVRLLLQDPRVNFDLERGLKCHKEHIIKAGNGKKYKALEAIAFSGDTLHFSEKL